ncbi:MAG: hypothetical protein QOG62_2683 [Thermoleophilaceae bacterium]|jgi:hypothetical protein|nr:hypothetical protein [Thermoleophilaceae bacterium]
MRRHLTYANVVATIALFLALSGGVVFAAKQIGSSDLAKRAVKTKNIADNAVRSPQIKNNDINSGDIRDQNVTGGDIADGTIETADLKDGAVKGGKVGDDSLTGADLQDGTIEQNDLGVPPETTMRGVVGASFPAIVDTAGPPHVLNTQGPLTAYASFPIPAPANLSNSDMSVDGPDCAGSPDAPTAPPGKLCVYTVTTLAAGNASSPSAVILGNGPTTRFGFRMTWNPTDPTLPSTLDGTWAYTAPALP